jgi:hypothetical protein
MKALARALSDKASSNFPDLELTFDQYIFSPLGVHANRIVAISGYLRSNWFDVDSPDVYFREMQPVAPIIGTGFLKTLELALKGDPQPKPIDSWWILDYPDVEMINLVSERQVTLLMATPRPAGIHPTGIWEKTAEAYTTGLFGLVTRKYE